MTAATSHLADIGDSVVKYLNDCSRSFSVGFAAVRSYLPIYSLAKGEIKNLQVFVFVSPEFKTETISREMKNETWQVQIGLVKKVSDKFDVSELDALVALYEEISASLVWQDFDPDIDGSTNSWNWKDQDSAPVYDAAELEERAVFAAAIKIHYEIHTAATPIHAAPIGERSEVKL